MILSDRDIRCAMQRLEDPLIIDPPIGRDQMQPCSIDLKLGPLIRIVDRWVVHPNVSGELLVTERTLGLHDISDGFELLPNEFVLAHSLETVRIPLDMVGQLNGRSTWARRGLMTHTVSGYMDAGFRGQITLELKNVSNTPVTLHPGDRLCNLIFVRMFSPPERPYGSEGLKSHYQGQSGPTPAAQDD